jgi:HNH endonuclease
MSWFFIDWTGKDYKLLSYWRELVRIKQEMGQDEAYKIPPDGDEYVEMLRSPHCFLYDGLTVHEDIQQPPRIRRKPINPKLRRVILEEKGRLCQVCKQIEYDHIHHIDGDASNNAIGNLMPICYKCHRDI